MLKRILIGLGVLVLLLVVGMAAVFHKAFGNNRPIADGQLVTGVQVVKDPLFAGAAVSVDVLDVAPGKVALIDAGNDKKGEAVLAALKARGMDANSVEAIFLTHGHPDHTAACRLFSNAAIYAMASEEALVNETAHVTHALKDGDIVHVGDLQVEAFAVPGHTAGSAVYLSKGVLFFGDSAGGAKDGTMMPAVSLFSAKADENVASLKALAARLTPRASEVHTLAFAHTGPLDGFAPLAAFASSH
jgi:hydroxyacylglutathione hydrolase